MAWIEQLPSGKYRGGWRDNTGRKHYTPAYTHKARAQKTATEQEQKHKQHPDHDPDSPKQTWTTWYNTWTQTRNVSNGTKKRDQSRAKRLHDYWGNTRLIDITRPKIRTWITHLQETTTLSPQTIKLTLNLLSTSLTGAVEADILTHNPAKDLNLRFPKSINERTLTRHEQHALFQALKTNQDRALLAILLGTGARWGEATALTAQHINTKTKTIRINQAYDHQTRTLNPYTKTKNSRTIPIANWVIEIITPQLKQNPTGYLFTNKHGNPLSYANWRNRVWVPALNEAGIYETVDGKPGIHMLRHTYATEQLDAGMSLAQIATLLGHSSVTTTERYAHRKGTVTHKAADSVHDPRTLD